ncbi:hypothetical protein PR001_g5221 [Phytophthora rubi]|uniref:Uncharacterized protein n=1 Tax=Phytophthora rubi TaxID=129364 RepID=A0A6A3NWL7_9STRA|nr:hypothetical protein PR002_g5663 [Phytophthora rubi]KAE9044821.1 hypothetical protein PR001_g5221 [Phytophthora rubi]
MTSDEVYEIAKQKEEAKATKLRLKAERKEAATLRKAAKVVRDAEAAKAKQIKMEAAAAARVAKAVAKAIKDAAKATAKAEKAADKAKKDAAMTAAKALKAVGKAKGTAKQRNAAAARSRSLLPAFESSPQSNACPGGKEAARIESTSEAMLKFTSGDPHTNILYTVSL